MGIDPQAKWIPSPFYNARGSWRPKFLILHGTAGGTSAAGIASWFQNPNAQVSAHYVIGVDGEVVCCVDESNWAWANGVLSAGHDPWWTSNINPNWISISIEHCKANSDNSNALTTAQKAASFALIKRICQRWGIPMRYATASGGITGHFSIDPVNRARCPGNYPWNELWSYLGGTSSSSSSGDLQMVEIGQGIGTHFTDSGNGRWHCKNTNVDLIGANLNFWRRYEGIGGLPLTNELYLKSINGKDASGTAIVVFERYIQIYDSARKIDNPPVPGNVYLLHIDSGYGQERIAAPLTDALNQAVATLKAQLEQAKQENHQAEVDALKVQLASYQTAIQQIQTAVQNIK